MFSRVVALLPFALLVTATAIKARGGQYCSSGDTKCCNQVQQYQYAGNLLKQYGVDQELAAIDVSPTTMLGFDCSPVLNIADGNSCTNQVACCTGNQYGLVNAQCNPINVNA